MSLIARSDHDESVKNGYFPDCPRGARDYARLKRARPGAIARCRVSGVLLALLFFLAPAGPTAASPIPVRAVATLNWSGYALAGGPFTGVTGTFNVPVPGPSASCLEQTAIWVGVDGLSNSDLLQAGIAETGFAVDTNRAPTDWPTPGTPRIVCWGRVEAYAWWEDLPSAAVRVALPVKVGDRVTVAIFRISLGWWVLAIHDLTARHSFLLVQPYHGPLTSVEWVAEDPQTFGTVNGPVASSTVHFFGLSAQGDPRGLERFSLGPGSHFESSAEAVSSTSQLLRAGFAIHFGS